MGPRARLLVVAGRPAEGRAEFEALRDRLAESPASIVLLQHMEAAGLADVALAWADEAVRALSADDMMRQLLLAHRRRIRTDLGLPLDDLDRTAVRIHIKEAD